jgi:hypothetical protein
METAGYKEKARPRRIIAQHRSDEASKRDGYERKLRSVAVLNSCEHVLVRQRKQITKEGPI